MFETRIGILGPRNRQLLIVAGEAKIKDQDGKTRRVGASGLRAVGYRVEEHMKIAERLWQR